MKIPGMDKLGAIGLVGERKAVALLSLGFFSTLFFLITVSARTELPEWLPLFSALTALYIVAFFGVAAEWFWGRWFATGLGYWGTSMSVLACVMTRSLPTAMIIFGVAHVLVALCLAGEKMAARFDAKPEWRERWKLDEQGVVRVRKSVTRAASSLPALILFALAPREGADAFGSGVLDLQLVSIFAVTLMALVGVLVFRRTFALLAFPAIGAWVLIKSLVGTGALYITHSYVDPAALPHAACTVTFFGALAGALLIGASAPFLGPMFGFLKSGERR